MMTAAPLSAQYAGPAILSRGEAPAALSLPEIRFRPYAEASGTYEQGLAGVSINEQGQLVAGHSFGMGLIWGVGGIHSWRHTKVGLDYRGSLLHYAQHQGFDSVDQALLISLTHQFTPHLSFDLRESAGLTARDFGQRGLRDTVPFDPSTTYVPTTDYFDNRTIFSTSTAMLQWQKTARLSFDLGGDAFVVRRRSSALFGSTGLTAHGDTEYRLSRRSTIGANYTFLHFTYGGYQGGTDAHGAALVYSVRLNRTTEFSGYAGGYRIESKFLQTTPLDPVIAVLLGIPGTTQIVHRINYTPNLGARFSRIYSTGMFFLSAGHSVKPGNGVFATSTASTVLTGYSYTGLRRWSFGASVGYERADSLGVLSGAYSDSQQGMQISRQVASHFHVIAMYSARQYSSPTYANYSRHVTDARIGIGYSPGEIPLRIW